MCIICNEQGSMRGEKFCKTCCTTHVLPSLRDEIDYYQGKWTAEVQLKPSNIAKLTHIQLKFVRLAHACKG